MIYCLSSAEEFELLNFMNFETVKFEISFAKSINLNLVFFDVKQCECEFDNLKI